MCGSEAHRERRAACPPLEKAAQLGASGLGSHVVVKRAGVERREAYWLAAARARLRKGTRQKITVMRETKGDARVLPECQQGTMEEST